MLITLPTPPVLHAVLLWFSQERLDRLAYIFAHSEKRFHPKYYKVVSWMHRDRYNTPETTSTTTLFDTQGFQLFFVTRNAEILSWSHRSAHQFRKCFVFITFSAAVLALSAFLHVFLIIIISPFYALEQLFQFTVFMEWNGFFGMDNDDVLSWACS